jgi:hypothetical protein
MTRIRKGAGQLLNCFFANNNNGNNNNGHLGRAALLLLLSYLFAAVFVFVARVRLEQALELQKPADQPGSLPSVQAPRHYPSAEVLYICRGKDP